ncbi:hypothetical protein [Rhodopila sp.]|jgi:flagellar protein FliO/FliZ|uniref:hypothetical protein n=1 Tax=Rhodopila sp. TaxID=2480087 RepID=UPI002B9C76E0|nr:hypothetical protein [Rhodopila sp.]HVZ09057.1 hypothetical protein [Rhodopila sp.]
MSGELLSLLTAAGALLAVLLLIAAGARLAQSPVLRGTANAGKTLALRESIALDPKRRLHLVQCGPRQVIVLTGGARDLVVGWIEPSA